MNDKQWRNLRNLCIVLFFCFCIGFVIGMEINKQQTQNNKIPSAYELLERIR